MCAFSSEDELERLLAEHPDLPAKRREQSRSSAGKSPCLRPESPTFYMSTATGFRLSLRRNER
jgi:hypothetical protein